MFPIFNYFMFVHLFPLLFITRRFIAILSRAMSATSLDIVQVNIYGVTLAEISQKGVNIPFLLVGICSALIRFIENLWN